MKMIGSKSIAQIVHEVNRIYCQALGDESQPEWQDAALWQKQSAEWGVQAIVDGNTTSPSASHTHWCLTKYSEGWAYGTVKDPVAKTHPCLVKYEQLPEEQKVKDMLFFSITKILLGQAYDSE